MAQRVIVLKDGRPIMDSHTDALDRADLEQRYSALVSA
jgi:ABC-type phosphate/phosphonate transport system ATPase subunit